VGLEEGPPDHSTISRTRRLIDLETHREVFTWVLGVLAEKGLLKGQTLGIDATGTYRSARENVDEDILTVGHGPFKLEVDLMQPIDAATKPAVHDPALNHIGLWVDDLAAAVTWLTAQGMRFTPGGIRKGAAGHDVCFIHPKGNEATPLCGEGVLIELVQAPPDVIAAFA
jgi:lactoylglutathione lyase